MLRRRTGNIGAPSKHYSENGGHIATLFAPLPVNQQSTAGFKAPSDRPLAGVIDDLLVSVVLKERTNGKPVLTTPVTTGRPALPTPVGSFSVHYRASPYTVVSPWAAGTRTGTRRHP